MAKRFVLGDTNRDICELWRAIIEEPEVTADAYQVDHEMFLHDAKHYEVVRDRYNASRSHNDFFFLVLACNLHQPHYTKSGRFSSLLNTTRPPKSPQNVRKQIYTAAKLLRGRTDVIHANWEDTLSSATKGDLAFLDPPYQGTNHSVYHDQDVSRARLESGIRSLQQRFVTTMITYDGVSNSKTYEPLSETLGLTRMFLRRNTNLHAFLNKKPQSALESFYLWPPRPKLQHQVIDRG